ncbi:Mitochondrial ATPase complex subunit atp10 [Marasmius sp. AFHP31]|nr:Mitochondrial ATPase complex subunit atp10 [Marasmius sp. AFHP31]
MFASFSSPLSGCCRRVPLTTWSRWAYVKRLNHSTNNLNNPSPSPKPPAQDSQPSSVPADSSLPPLDIAGLPYLSKPLGVTERPSTQRNSTFQRIKQKLTDDETIARERKHLVKEIATKGYFHDLTMTKKHGGKTWIAPKVLIREDRALYMPDISGTSLETGSNSEKHTTTMCFGRITALSLLSTRISELHSAAFTSPTLQRYASHPLFQHIQINTQSNALKSFLVRLLTRSLRSSIPKEQHPFYLLSSQNLEYLREPLGINNDRVGYVYLIDENCKVRWAGCADATAEEAKALEVCTGILLRRLDEKEEQERGRGKSKPSAKNSLL